MHAVVEKPVGDEFTLELLVVIVQQPPSAWFKEVVGRLVEILRENLFGERSVKVVAEDVREALACSRETRPHVDLDGMRLFVQSVERIERFAHWPAHPRLTVLVLAPKDLLVGKQHLRPIVDGPVSAALSEGKSLFQPSL